MDDGRDLIEDIAEILDAKGAIEFNYTHLPVEDHAYVATRAGFEDACKHHPLDTHRIVSFDLIAPQDLFETADDVYDVLGPTGTTFTGFDPDYVFYMAQTSFARDAHALITKGDASRVEQTRRLLKLLDTFPLRLLSGSEGCELFAVNVFAANDLKINRLLAGTGNITPDAIENCYTSLAHVDDPSCFEDRAGATSLEDELAAHLAWYSRNRFRLVDF